MENKNKKETEQFSMFYRLWVELYWRWIPATADAAVTFHFTAEEFPPSVQLRVCPVTLCLYKQTYTDVLLKFWDNL